MFSEIKFSKFIVCFFCFVFLFSCGKIVQQTTDDSNVLNSFVLNYKTDQLYFKPTELNSSILSTSNIVRLPELNGVNFKRFSNNDVWVTSYFKNKQVYEVVVKDDAYYSELVSKQFIDLDAAGVIVDSFVFDSENPIYTLIRGYKKDKVYELAWGYCLLEKTLSPNKQSPNNPDKLFLNEKYNYKPVFYDKDKIKVTDVKKSQISGKLVSSSLELNLTSSHVSRDYDYYLVALYSAEDSFQMKVVSNEYVSKNMIVNLDFITPLDTFRSLIYIEAFRNDSVDLGIYAGLNQLFDQQFFDSLDYKFQSFDLKLFSKKRPQFKYVDLAIQEYVFILDLAFIDINEAVTYVTQNEKKFLTKEQQGLLINSIKLLKSSNVE
jgi:hypothetical protein